MVAITTQPAPLRLPMPARSVGRPALHIVDDLDQAPATWGRFLAMALLVLATVLAVGYLIQADPAPASGTVTMGTHVVAEGESMWSIARSVAPVGEAAIYVERLVEANGTGTVSVGQVLQLPIP